TDDGHMIRPASDATASVLLEQHVKSEQSGPPLRKREYQGRLVRQTDLPPEGCFLLVTHGRQPADHKGQSQIVCGRRRQLASIYKLLIRRMLESRLLNERSHFNQPGGSK